MTSQTALTQESQMVQLHPLPNREQVIDTMIGLTRLSNLHRTIVAGSDSLVFFVTLVPVYQPQPFEQRLDAQSLRYQ